MTSPKPISIFYPTCSNCWEVVKNPIFFVLDNGEIHWACSDKCKNDLIAKNKINYCKSLDKLKKMYLQIFLETSMGNKFRKVEKLNKKFYEEKTN